MSRAFGDLTNTSHASASSYETAWSSSFDKRNVVDVKVEPEDPDVSTLENDISMMSVSSPVAPRTPNNKKDDTPARKLLRSVNNKEERQLLLELYPDFFAENENDDEKEKKKPSPPLKPVKKEIKIELFGSDDEKENIFPGFSPRIGESSKKSIKVEKRSPTPDSNDDKDFENYLKKLREPVQPPRKTPTPESDFGISKKSRLQNKRSPTPESEDDFENYLKKLREPVAPPRKTPTPELDFGNFESKKKRSPTPESEDDFENYLKKLKEPAPSAQPKVKKNIKNFVVEDDYFSEDEGEDSDDDEDYDDEEESILELSSLSPEVAKVPKKPKDDDTYFLTSLSIDYNGTRHPEAENFVKPGSIRMKKNKEALLLKLVEVFRRRCFPEIPEEKLKLIWNARLRKTAGLCRNHSNGQSTIEMSTVVCTSAERIRDTLVHEMCHAAVWIVDKLYKEGHGPGWKKWGNRCARTFACLPAIERCHDYEIEAKFWYICETKTCQQTIKRQSKSLDIAQKICGRCRGRFQLHRFDKRTNRHVLVTEKDGEGSENPKKVNQYMVYVKENFGRYKNSGLKHQEIMAKLSEDYKLQKALN